MINNNSQNQTLDTESKINLVFESFRQNGGRLTNQREELIRIIMNNPDSSSKEIFYLAKLSNKDVSRATVYRTINSLVNMGFISYRTISLK